MLRDFKGRFKAQRRGQKVLLIVMLVCFSIPTLNLFWDATGWNLGRDLVAVNVAYAGELPKARHILDDIADCESGIRKADGSAVEGSARQFLANGKVVRNRNTNGSDDVGRAQINLGVHIDEVSRLKLDVINSEEDNKAFAAILYERNGTADWNASRSCWDR
jgi:hypothetical protein